MCVCVEVQMAALICSILQTAQFVVAAMHCGLFWQLLSLKLVCLRHMDGLLLPKLLHVEKTLCLLF